MSLVFVVLFFVVNIFIIISIFLILNFINKRTCKECGLKIKNKHLTRCPKCGYVLTRKGV